jgi:hypothetical protein
MPRIIRRNRVISIRLSNEEYDEVHSLCAHRGTDSISELARTALKLLAMNEEKSGKVGIESHVETIHARISVLDREVARLSNLLGVDRLAGHNDVH